MKFAIGGVPVRYETIHMGIFEDEGSGDIEIKIIDADGDDSDVLVYITPDGTLERGNFVEDDLGFKLTKFDEIWIEGMDIEN